MVPIATNLSKDDANTLGLVLSASDIIHWLEKDKNRWKLLVNDADVSNAEQAVEKYFDENRNFKNDSHPLIREYQKTYSGIWVAVILAACHVSIQVAGISDLIIGTYGASAYHILHGELYRSVTALMLHASPLHIMGNTVGIAIFGTAVCSIMGWGAGWLMILLTGMLGNLANAWLYQTGHMSIGASTAIFGAVGILSAYQLFRKLKQREKKIQALLPLGGGLALLGILGMSQSADLMAHLFGFFAGIVLGSIYSNHFQGPLGKTYQAFSLLGTLGILSGAWIKIF